MISKRASRRRKPRRNPGQAPVAQPDAGTGDKYPAAWFHNREISWLEFNRRVLHEAQDPRTPLLERVNFLGIFESNLDEFFMKRVGGLKRQIATGVQSLSLDGKTASRQLEEVRALVREMLDDQAVCYRESIRPALLEHGVHLLGWEELGDADRAFAGEHFQDNIFPMLTPLSVDLGHPFPSLSNLSLSLGVRVRYPGQEELLFARVKVPGPLPQWIRLPDADSEERYRFVSLQDVMRHNAARLFPGMEIVSVMPFRITRSADSDRDTDDDADLLEMIAEELRERRFADAVRLEHGPDPDPWMLSFLVEELKLREQDVYEVAGELNYAGLSVLQELSLPELKCALWSPVVPPTLVDEEAGIFDVIRAGDILVHHPYESFGASVERFIEAAAHDARVLAIKMTLYRTGRASPFTMLIRAAEAGKQVVCLVELMARFDEQRNIEVAQMLEEAGVHVVYGIVGLKTHAKMALVVRQEREGIRTYAHIGTGNYHSGTAQLYTDLGLFTAKPEFTGDVVEIFNFLTGRSLKREYKKLLVAPVNMKRRFVEMIDREAENAAAGRPAQVVAKVNSLEDRRIIARLYAASQAGVPIDLIVRGFCCLKAGVPGLSDHIRVVSVVGRFLEHSRLFYFRNGAEDPVDGLFFIGSADWMYRNLDYRVEAITPIEDRALRERCWQILQITLADQRQAWDLQPDGTYVQRQPTGSDFDEGAQQALMRLATAQHRIKAGIEPGDPSAIASISRPRRQSG